MALPAVSKLKHLWGRYAAVRFTCFSVLIVGLLSFSWLGWSNRPLRFRRPIVVRLIPPPSEAEGGLSSFQLGGYAELVVDHLSELRDVTLFRGADPENVPNGRIFELELSPRKDGERLIPAFRWRETGGSSWQEVTTTSLPPKQALAWMLEHLPFDVPQDRNNVLTPQNQGTFWQLLELLYAASIEVPPPRALEHARDFTAAEPGCAIGWCVRGILAFRRLLLQSNRDIQIQQEAESCFQHALELAPNHPLTRAVYARFRSRLGDHGGGLSVLIPAFSSHRRNLAAHEALAHIACRAGLLDLVRREHESRKSWLSSAGSFELAALYLGDLNAFESSLLRKPGSRSPFDAFYLGYARLLSKDSKGALSFFEEAAKGIQATSGVERLAPLFALWCAGQNVQMGEKLSFYLDEHMFLRSPDGEYTFKLAEAAAMAGQETLALDLTCRAAAQGFDCTHWYETSPCLESIRPRPQYQALLKILKERQARLEKRFKPGLFGL